MKWLLWILFTRRPPFKCHFKWKEFCISLKLVYCWTHINFEREFLLVCGRVNVCVCVNSPLHISRSHFISLLLEYDPNFSILCDVIFIIQVQHTSKHVVLVVVVAVGGGVFGYGTSIFFPCRLYHSCHLMLVIKAAHVLQKEPKLCRL